MKGKGRKGEPEGAEREEKPHHHLLLGTVRRRVLLEGPRFLGTQRAAWRETSELEAGLNTPSPKEAGREGRRG